MKKLEKWLYIYGISLTMLLVGALWLCLIVVPSVFTALELENWIILVSIMFPCALLTLPLIAMIEVYLYWEIIDTGFDLAQML